MKLFPKLALVSSVFFLVTVVGLSALIYWAEGRQIRKDARTEQEMLLQDLVRIAQDSFVSQDDLLLAKYTRSLLSGTPALLSAGVVDANGHILAHSQPRRIGQTSPETTQAYSITLSEPVRVGPHLFGTASVTFSQQMLDEELDLRLNQLRQRIAPIAVVAFIIGLLGAFLTALSWTRPIKQVVRQTELVGQGRWKEVDLGLLEKRSDEIGMLSRATMTMAHELEQLDQMKEDFVSAVTHELRSPLGAIESFLNLIDDDKHQGRPPADWDDYHRRIRVNVKRLTKFVNDLLDVAQLDRGKVHLEPQVVNAETLVQSAVELFEPTINQRNLKLEIKMSDPGLKVLVDADKITQVLMNLLSNAIKFTPEGGRLGVTLKKSDSTVEFAVSDTGIGIREEDQKKIFSKFEQVKSSRQQVKTAKGTGLGLSICRGLVELHGGMLRLRSKWGEGSTFSFTVPMAHAGVKPIALRN